MTFLPIRSHEKGKCKQCTGIHFLKSSFTKRSLSSSGLNNYFCYFAQASLFLLYASLILQIFWISIYFYQLKQIFFQFESTIWIKVSEFSHIIAALFSICTNLLLMIMCIIKYIYMHIHITFIHSMILFSSKVFVDIFTGI